MNFALYSLLVCFIALTKLTRIDLLLPVIGTMLSKMCTLPYCSDIPSFHLIHLVVLVLGICFFAGGLRFSELGFDASTTLVDIHRLYTPI